MRGQMPSPRDAYVRNQGLRLRYARWGEASSPALVLLHGLGDCAQSWHFLAASLAHDFHVMALDQRGHGDSERAEPGHYRPQDYLADLKALLDEAALPRPVVLGHGASAGTALQLALDQPESVGGVVLADADPGPDVLPDLGESADEGEVMRHLRDRAPHATDEILAHQADCLTRPAGGDARAWRMDPAVIAGHVSVGGSQPWAELAVPMLIVRGRESQALSHEAAVAMREAVPRVRLAELDGGGHWLYWEFPGAFEATVRWFMDYVGSHPGE